MFSPTEASLLAALVGLIGIVVTVFVMKGNSDSRYVTKEQCATQQQIQCAERATIREELKGLKRTQRIALSMCRALVSHADIPDKEKAEILNSDGGPQ